jgi:hypothetical protein
MSDVLTPGSFPPNNFVGRLELVLIGIAIDAVAATLTDNCDAGVRCDEQGFGNKVPPVRT